VRGADHTTRKSQPTRAEASWGRHLASLSPTEPIVVVRHAAVFFAFTAAFALANCKEFVREVWGRAMRAGILGGCMALALLVGGCDTTDTNYFRYGVGTNLYSEDIVQTTQLQDIYFTELCRQALPLISTSDSVCINAMPNAVAWGSIVQAGLNDIDRRCDSYLAWLDDRRRTNNAVLKELADVTVASQAIMRVGGVGANPITLAGLAFGLAANTFTNVNSRLLLEVDKTTVQTLVLRRRDDYRFQLRSIQIESKPAAVHALRSYLNICTPYTIETDINSTITVFQTGGPAALNRPPLINAETVRSTTIVRARDPLPKSDFSQVRPSAEKAFVTNVQQALCVPNATGTVDPPTITAIQTYLIAQKKTVPDSIVPASAALSPILQKAIDEVGACSTFGFKNAFEVGRYGVPAENREKRIKTLQKKLADFFAGKSQVSVPQSGKMEDTRAGIAEFRRLDGTLGTGDELDEPTLRKILRSS